MRIVLDTNVFVSAVLKVNSLPYITVRWVDRHGGLLKTAATERELLAVLERPHIAAVTDPGFRAGLANMLNRSRSPSGSPLAAIRPTTSFSSWGSTAGLI
jgi:predicted nucleic acid-binding protein